MSMDWTGKRVLVTGSAGVIGRVLVKKLVDLGAELLSLDIAPADTIQRPATHVQVDLAREIPALVTEFRPQVALHLAASFERTLEEAGYWKASFDNNVLASHRLLEVLATETALETFVFASSYLIYDSAQYLDAPTVHYLKETDAITPRNLVGMAKYFFEEELRFVADTEQRFRAVSARIYRVYGRGSRDVISRWVRAALAGEPLELYGRGGRFDYIFADDVATGLIKLTETETARGVVNLGSGTPRQVEDVIEILKSEISPLQVVEFDDDYPLEASCADMSYFKQLTGWRPEFSLEAGVKAIIAYETKRKQLL